MGSQRIWLRSKLLSKTIMPKKIVTIGGGTGQPTLLRALLQTDVDVSAIVTMMDSGGSSGKLREQYNVLPPGDVRRCLLALSTNPEQLQWWEHRFADGDLAGHVVGNIALTALFQHTPIQAAIDQMAEVFQVRGRVIAVTDQFSHVQAQLSDGMQIIGEDYFTHPTHPATVRVEKIWLDPAVTLAPLAAEAIATADLIVLTMGSLYASLIPNLLVTGMTDALAAATAPIISICNRSAKRGETEGYTTADIAAAIEKYLAPAKLSTMIIDDGSVPLPADALPVAFAPLPNHIRVIKADLSDPSKLALVSGEKVTKILEGLV